MADYDYSSYERLIIEIKDGIALVTINRPEVYNATDFKLHNELSLVWLDLGKDDAVRVIVITGAGTAFSAGGDFDLIEKSIGNAK
ncbi:MAG: enoyl-CoA hydratase/isomerase family protein, partial [Chloroflexi bacterium]|nr:enoyl-CoA hydratase/isomerase family protein [Chloroflexota bacterium]